MIIAFAASGVADSHEPLQPAEDGSTLLEKPKGVDDVGLLGEGDESEAADDVGLLGDTDTAGQVDDAGLLGDSRKPEDEANDFEGETDAIDATALAGETARATEESGLLQPEQNSHVQQYEKRAEMIASTASTVVSRIVIGAFTTLLLFVVVFVFLWKRKRVEDREFYRDVLDESNVETYYTITEYVANLEKRHR